jgi:hypothetical protein
VRDVAYGALHWQADLYMAERTLARMRRHLPRQPVELVVMLPGDSRNPAPDGHLFLTMRPV